MITISLAAALLLPALPLAAQPPSPDSITGQAVVEDGDGLKMGNTRIRFFGIDALEMGQRCFDLAENSIPCGQLAADALRRMVQDEEVRCDIREQDRYGRSIASCYVGRKSLSKEMVRQGWAVPFVRYSDLYVKDYQKARQSRLGAHRWHFSPPWAWRRGRTCRH
jgi:endonuclease YncB( thermonuclease family)